MADEPMTDERLAEIRRMVSRAEVSMMASSDVALRDLLAEVERRRAREAAAMEVVRAVAQNDMVIPLRGSARCVFWDCEYDGINDHSSNCPWMKARALLADEGH